MIVNPNGIWLVWLNLILAFGMLLVSFAYVFLWLRLAIKYNVVGKNLWVSRFAWFTVMSWQIIVASTSIYISLALLNPSIPFPYDIYLAARTSATISMLSTSILLLAILLKDYTNLKYHIHNADYELVNNHLESISETLRK